MRKLLLVMLACSMLSFAGRASAQHQNAPLTMANHTDFIVRFFVDDQQVCTSDTQPGLDCDHQLPVGRSYALKATRPSTGDIVKQENVTPDGSPIIWTVTGKEARTLEGKWMILTSFDTGLVGKYWIFTRDGDSFVLSLSSTPGSETIGSKSCGHATFRGGPTEFTALSIPNYDCLLYMYNATPKGPNDKSFKKLAGRLRFNERIVLSPDGNSAVHATDAITIRSTGSHLDGTQVNPFGNVTTLTRVSLRQ